jgi:alkylation response protein AidB-like acyl-CoA dehydrogenase
MSVLNGGRIGSLQVLGIATGSYELALKYLKNVKLGKEIFKHQAIALNWSIWLLKLRQLKC